MSAPIRVKVEADIGSDTEAYKATQDLWRLAETRAGILSEINVTEQVELILARKAELNAHNGDGVTALMMAAYNGRLQMVRVLIDHGADLNATREDGFTALGLAALLGHTEVVRLLVEGGADLSKATPFGKAADMWGTARSFFEIAQYLERARSTALGSSAPQSSAPKSNALESSAHLSSPNELGVVPSLAENQPIDELRTAEPIRAEQPQQLTPADSDLTIATPRITVPDQLIAQHAEENPGTGQGSRHASAKPAVVRTLKDPPEIWDLVRETPEHFNPRGAFVTRLTSSKTNLVLLMLVVILISGLATFGVMTLRDRNRGGAAAQLQDEHGNNQTLSASQASAPANAPESAPLNAPASAPVDTHLNSQLNTTPSTADGVDNTPAQQTEAQPRDPQPRDPQSTDPYPTGQPDNPASAGNALNKNVQPTSESVNRIQPAGVSANSSVQTTSEGANSSVRSTGVNVNTILTRTVWLAGTAALSGNKRITHGRRNADKSRPARGEGETAAGPDTNARPQPPNTADLKQRDEKSSSDPSSATRRSDTTSSPQQIAPPKASSTPKPKVIQWP